MLRGQLRVGSRRRAEFNSPQSAPREARARVASRRYSQLRHTWRADGKARDFYKGIYRAVHQHPSFHLPSAVRRPVVRAAPLFARPPLTRRPAAAPLPAACVAAALRLRLLPPAAAPDMTAATLSSRWPVPPPALTRKDPELTRKDPESDPIDPHEERRVDPLNEPPAGFMTTLVVRGSRSARPGTRFCSPGSVSRSLRRSAVKFSSSCPLRPRCSIQQPLGEPAPD